MSSPAAAPVRVPSHLSREAALFLGIVLGVTLLAYLPTLRFDFVYDDVFVLVRNPTIRAWHFLPGYFARQVWGDQGPTLYYRPGFLVWALLNFELFGLHAAGWHATTLLLHLVATVLVFLLACRLTGNDRAAALAALIFGLHPAHIEAVAWISGGSEPMLAVPILAAFLCFLNWHDARGGKWLACSLAFGAAALACKETAIAFPALVFAYTVLYEAREDQLWRRILRAVVVSAPYAALTLAYVAVRAQVLGTIGVAAEPLPFKVLVLTWPSVLWFYVRMLFLPIGLSEYYDLPYVERFSVAHVALPLFAVAVFAAAIVWWARRSRSRVVAFAGWWLLLPMLPALDLAVFRAGELVHDRYLYLASVGFALLAGIALDRIPDPGPRFHGFSARTLVATAALAAAMSFGVVYYSYFWQDGLALFSRAVVIAPESPWAHNNLGVQLGDRGRVLQAMAQFERALQLQPVYGQAAANLGYEYYVLGDLENAAKWLSYAIRVEPQRSDSWFHLGIVQSKAGRPADARASLEQAIALSPRTVQYHVILGIVLGQQGDCAGAHAQFAAELALDSANAIARQELAIPCPQP